MMNAEIIDDVWRKITYDGRITSLRQTHGDRYWTTVTIGGDLPVIFSVPGNTSDRLRVGQRITMTVDLFAGERPK